MILMAAALRPVSVIAMSVIFATSSAVSSPFSVETTTLTLVAGSIYRRHKTKKMAVVGLLCGTIAMTAMMFAANLIITPLFMGVTREVVMSLMPFILAFNVVKAGINSVVTFILYKRISPFLHR